ncbi:GTPase ObgE [Oceanivirga miroungae]|uniref:GTPase Obg n=1 Tax=Oceanivirga miroungae TaxID=1130046 RepID=A0A6I8MCE7_9FUSO|nr:GTPase ObgE [Oceanivirga miroungae]VWL85141.1 GTPase ObgE [Oceanivirga miroungae]
MFIDESVITVKSGDGGDGAATFRREKFVQFGGPDGGDGGKGGDVIFFADPNMNTLLNFKNIRKLSATNGAKGSGSRCAGKNGEDVIIHVPVGTMIRDFETNKLLLDLNKANETRTLLKGGDGGRGNIHFKNSIRKAPKIAESGRSGIELKVKLELKMLADVALVGYPSVGKSSLINKVSQANSKVGAYHFTTLKPKLGVVRVNDTDSFVIADIPGLIEGAHSGIGLGDKFLKHIERCKLIVHMVDISEIDGRSAIEDYYKINEELEKFSSKLSKKNQIVVLNKVDMLFDETKIEEFKNKVKVPVHEMSVISNYGIKELINLTNEKLKEIEYEDIEDIRDLDEVLQEVIKRKEDWIIKEIEPNVFEVSGQVVDNVLNKYVFLGEEGIIQFLQVMRNIGMEQKLLQAGVKIGDTIVIEGYEFEYV